MPKGWHELNTSLIFEALGVRRVALLSLRNTSNAGRNYELSLQGVAAERQRCNNSDDHSPTKTLSESHVTKMNCYLSTIAR